MNILSITYSGEIQKPIDGNELTDAMEMLFGMCNKEITHWANGITGKSLRGVKKYKKNKVLFDNLQNDALEYVSFMTLPEDYVQACFDYFIYISINYKYRFVTATYEQGLLNDEKTEILKKILEGYMRAPYIEEIYVMDKEETPFSYAAKINPSSSYKTLQIISNRVVETKK